MTIAQLAVITEKTLQREAPRARERRLDAAHIEHAIRVHLKHARRVAREDESRITRTTLCGGYVANSYKHSASADHLAIEGTSAKVLSITAGRCAAQRRPHGVGETLIVRSRTPDQDRGRIEHKE